MPGDFPLLFKYGVTLWKPSGIGFTDTFSSSKSGIGYKWTQNGVFFQLPEAGD